VVAAGACSGFFRSALFYFACSPAPMLTCSIFSSLGRKNRGNCPNFELLDAIAPQGQKFLDPPAPRILTVSQLVRQTVYRSTIAADRCRPNRASPQFP